MRAITDAGYDKPTPIQAQAIPLVLEGRDLLAAAQTGTGKTAGFTLPILQRLSATNERPRPGRPRCLILTPTRELAAQVGESVDTYGRHLKLSSLIVFGGVNINPQLSALRKPIDILIATPGRLLDHAGQRSVDLSGVEILVLDEADRMLDMGFIRDIRRVLALLPRQRQNLLFSATFSDEIRQLANGLLHNPATVEVARRNTASELVDQSVHLVPKAAKRGLLSYLIGSNRWTQVLVFTRTKHGANRLAEQLGKDGIEAMAIHGNKSQNARTRALAAFKDGSLPVLVATDIAARGLDIEQLPHVVNYELPNVAEDYVHRIGRTGRAGSTGAAVSLVDDEEIKLLAGIERLIGRRIPRVEVEGFTLADAARHESDAAQAAPRNAPRRSQADGRRGGAERRDNRHENRHDSRRGDNRGPRDGRGKGQARDPVQGQRRQPASAAPEHSPRPATETRSASPSQETAPASRKLVGAFGRPLGAAPHPLTGGRDTSRSHGPAR
ncbi:MAG: DEAD/DEAH box helicase [Burkholderiaceae bacterium]